MKEREQESEETDRDQQSESFNRSLGLTQTMSSVSGWTRRNCHFRGSNRRKIEKAAIKTDSNSSSKITHQSIPNLRITMDSPICPSIPLIPKLYISLVGMQLVLRGSQEWKVEILRFLFILGFRACGGLIGSVWSLERTQRCR